LDQGITKDSLAQSTIKYFGQSNSVLGLEFNYDKINFSFGIKSSPQPNASKTGNTDYFSLGTNIGGNKWILEAGYKRFYGLYDQNTGAYDKKNFDSTGVYHQFPHLAATSFKMKFMYFANHKRFAFKAGYSCAYRQLRSSISPIITANWYYNAFKSDTSLIPPQIASYYDTHADLKEFNVGGVSVYGGLAANIVLWRSVFWNLTLLLGPEQQWRTYRYINNTYNNNTTSYLGFSSDFRTAFGLNYKYCFFMFQGKYDQVTYGKPANLRFHSTFFSWNFTMGFRFRVKPPKLYQRFQKTKLYGMM
jgi:hypothetical protein